MHEMEMFSVVALLHDLPEHGLVHGQMGTVVEGLAQGGYEVEFCGDDGRNYAMAQVHYHSVPGAE